MRRPPRRRLHQLEAPSIHVRAGARQACAIARICVQIDRNGPLACDYTGDNARCSPGPVPDNAGVWVVTARVSKILIVDDTPHNIDVLSATLNDEQCELMAATSGTRALELATRGRPDLVLLDVMMPGMDGFEGCRRLKADPVTADIPVIFVTARTDDVSQGFAVGRG